MAEPWPMKPSDIGPGWFEVTDDANFSCWPTEALARRYAALPVLIEAIREACADTSGFTPTHCRFCDSEDEGDDDGFIHNSDCPGIAALKAAGEMP